MESVMIIEMRELFYQHMVDVYKIPRRYRRQSEFRYLQCELQDEMFAAYVIAIFLLVELQY